MKSRRSSIEIIADILKVGEHGARKTEIMYRANTSYSQVQKYLGLLLANDCIDQFTLDNSHFNYRVTEKGSDLLKSIQCLLEDLNLKVPVDS